MAETRWAERLRRWILPVPATGIPHVEPGLYHFHRERDGQHVRLHLRVEPRGDGLLIAAAAEIVRLSAAGVFAAKGLLEGRSPQEIADALTAANSRELVDEVARLIDDLGRPDRRYPVLNPSDPALANDPRGMLAPLRADLVCDGNLAVQRKILDRLWELGIPHVRLLARSQPDVAQLIDLVERAEDVGLIAGLTAPAGFLAVGNHLERLAGVGLDYVVVPLAPPSRQDVAGESAAAVADPAALVRKIAGLEMAPVVEFPLLRGGDLWLEEHLPPLIEAGIGDVEVFAVVSNDAAAEVFAAGMAAGQRPDATATAGPLSADEMAQMAAWIDDLAVTLGIRIAWLPPRICGPGEFPANVARGGPRAGHAASIRVEADGAVLPPVGSRAAVGNLLDDPWPRLWTLLAGEGGRPTPGEQAESPELEGQSPVGEWAE